eukprot:gene8616-6048_t
MQWVGKYLETIREGRLIIPNCSTTSIHPRLTAHSLKSGALEEVFRAVPRGVVDLDNRITSKACSDHDGASPNDVQISVTADARRRCDGNSKSDYPSLVVATQISSPIWKKSCQKTIGVFIMPVSLSRCVQTNVTAMRKRLQLHFNNLTSPLIKTLNGAARARLDFLSLDCLSMPTYHQSEDLLKRKLDSFFQIRSTKVRNKNSNARNWVVMVARMNSKNFLDLRDKIPQSSESATRTAGTPFPVGYCAPTQIPISIWFAKIDEPGIDYKKFQVISRKITLMEESPKNILSLRQNVVDTFRFCQSISGPSRTLHEAKTAITSVLDCLKFGHAVWMGHDVKQLEAHMYPVSDPYFRRPTIVLPEPFFVIQHARHSQAARPAAESQNRAFPQKNRRTASARQTPECYGTFRQKIPSFNRGAPLGLNLQDGIHQPPPLGLQITLPYRMANWITAQQHLAETANHIYFIFAIGLAQLFGDQVGS